MIPLGALVAGGAGVLLGAPTLKLRGDYLAIVTLGFGEIVRVFMNNLDAPVNITNGPKGITGIDEISIFGFSLGKTQHFFGLEWPKVTNYYFLFLLLVIFAVVICYRLERSRIGRAWMAIREDEVAAKAMGINTRNLKLLAFGMGATFGGVSGVMFASFQGFISPESFSLQESVMIVAMVVLGGIGHLPGVIVGALLLAALPEVLRYVAGPLQQMTDGRLDASILRQLLIALAMIGIMLSRPRGLWPSPEHGRVRAAGAETPPPRGPGRRAAGQAAARELPPATQIPPTTGHIVPTDAMSDADPARERRVEALRRAAGALRRRHHDHAGPGLRPDRSERRRQDDLLQRPHRPLHARLGIVRARRQAVPAERGARGRQGRASRARSRTSACSPT